ncbi:MAG: adenylate/guanylate cyclase domain-containing protein [Paracoccaceae bacterium]
MKSDGPEFRAIIAAFAREQQAGALLGFQARAVGVLVIGLSLLLRAGGGALLYYIAILLVLLLSGWAFYLTTTMRSASFRIGARLLRPGLIAADMALITAALVVPAPGAPEAWPAAMQLRLGDIGFLFVFLAFSALTYSPGLALWAGLVAGGAWIGGVAWTLNQPGSFTRGVSDFGSMEVSEALETLLDPHYVSVIAAGQEAFLLTITGAVIAAAVWRGRRQAFRQIGTARERAKLARYFSPDLAEELAHGSAGLEEMRTRRAAILFADIFGFTGIAEKMTPEETLAFLREFHAIATAEVFTHHGTLNKFIGDEVMASFGAIHDMEKEAAAALACAAGIARRVDAWSMRRVAEGREPVRVGVGLHIGEVVVGNIGDQRCLELAVLGDVVNVASRLQQATRRHDACIIVSRDVIDAATREEIALVPLIEGFAPLEGESVRGKAEAVDAAALSSDTLKMLDKRVKFYSLGKNG